MNPSVRGAQTPATEQARDVATWLLDEAAAHRLDPIVSCEARYEWVHLTVRPESAPVWHTWCNLLTTGRVRINTADGIADTVGRWEGVSVRLTAIDVASWITS